MLGKLEKVLAGEVAKLLRPVGVAKTAEKAVWEADGYVSAAIKEFAAHFRLNDAPELVGHLAKADEFWGRDVTRRIARDHLGHRGGFIVDVVATAERRGYLDLKGLQASIPEKWLSRGPCPFCHAHEKLVPKSSIVYESANFMAAPNERQLFGDAPGAHMMVFAKHHRSTSSALPEKYRQELVDTIRKVKAAMTEANGQPVSIFSNGGAGAKQHILEDVDSHAHMQLFSGSANVTDRVLKEIGLTRERVIPVNSFEEYFKLYETGKLRGRYLLTLDANERGHVILIGDLEVKSGLAMRNARAAIGLDAFPGEGFVPKDHTKASLVAAALKTKLAAPADTEGVRAILAGAPIAP